MGCLAQARTAINNNPGFQLYQGGGKTENMIFPAKDLPHLKITNMDTLSQSIHVEVEIMCVLDLSMYVNARLSPWTSLERSTVDERHRTKEYTNSGIVHK